MNIRIVIIITFETFKCQKYEYKSYQFKENYQWLNGPNKGELKKRNIKWSKTKNDFHE